MSEQPDQFQQLLATSKVTIAPQESDADAALRRRKDWLLFQVSLAGTGSFLLAAAIFAFGPWGSPPQQALAANLLTALAGGFFGYLFGKRS